MIFFRHLDYPKMLSPAFIYKLTELTSLPKCLPISWYILIWICIRIHISSTLLPSFSLSSTKRMLPLGWSSWVSVAKPAVFFAILKSLVITQQRTHPWDIVSLTVILTSSSQGYTGQAHKLRHQEALRSNYIITFKYVTRWTFWSQYCWWSNQIVVGCGWKPVEITRRLFMKLYPSHKGYFLVGWAQYPILG